VVAVARKVYTAGELEAMTPAEQDAAFAASLLTDLTSVPAPFLERVRSRLAASPEGADRPRQR